MRMLTLGLLLLPAIAAADVARYRTTLDVHVDDPDKKLTVATLTESLVTADGTVLDACWKKPATMKVKVVFDHGKVASVDASGGRGDRTLEACVAKALRAITLADSKGRVTATFGLGGAVRPPPAKQGLISGDTKQAKLDSILDDRNLNTSLSKFSGIKGAGGIGFGTGIGSGTAPATGGFGSGAPPAAGGSERASGVVAGAEPGRPTPRLSWQPPWGTFNKRTAEEIQRVVLSRAGVFRACYQKELARTPELAGKVVVTFLIPPDGITSRALVDTARTTLSSEAVSACITTNLLRLRFPVTDAPSEVSLPFLFSTGA